MKKCPSCGVFSKDSSTLCRSCGFHFLDDTGKVTYDFSADEKVIAEYIPTRKISKRIMLYGILGTAFSGIISLIVVAVAINSGYAAYEYLVFFPTFFALLSPIIIQFLSFRGIMLTASYIITNKRVIIDFPPSRQYQRISSTPIDDIIDAKVSSSSRSKDWKGVTILTKRIREISNEELQSTVPSQAGVDVAKINLSDMDPRTRRRYLRNAARRVRETGIRTNMLYLSPEHAKSAVDKIKTLLVKPRGVESPTVNANQNP